MKVSQKEFDRIVKQSITRIPREFRQYLENILIAVQKRPSRALLQEMGLLPHETLLGIYRGCLPGKAFGNNTAFVSGYDLFVSGALGGTV